MRVAMVVQRYGRDVIGGAEKLAREISIALSSKLDWDIEIFTTTAIDYTTWKNHFPEGTELDGVKIKVHRFNTTLPRIPLFFNVYHRLTLKLFRRSTRSDFVAWCIRILFPCIEYFWYILQGPYAPSLTRELKKRIKAKDFDLLILKTYLYKPTVDASKIPEIKKIFISSAHDEPPLYFPTTKLVFESVDAIAVNSDAEGDLIRKTFKELKVPITMIGSGVDALPTSSSPKDKKVSAEKEASDMSEAVQCLSGQDYILYLGRIDILKGCERLIRLFKEYRKKNPQHDLKLVLAGFHDKNVLIPKDADIQYLGFVNESEKDFLLANAKVVANLSSFESLSFVVLEAFLNYKTCIVSMNCEVMANYVRQTQTCFGIVEDEDFQNALDQALDLMKQLKQNKPEILDRFYASKRWVEQRYTWDVVVKKYEEISKKLLLGK